MSGALNIVSAYLKDNSMGCYPGPAPVLTPHGRRMCPGGARCSEDISWRYLAISGEAISGHLMENRIFVRRSAVVASAAETGRWDLGNLDPGTSPEV